MADVVDNRDDVERADRRGRSRTSWVLAAFLAIAAFYILTEHLAHLFGILPYVLLLACPLMYVFMHRKHGGHEHDARRHRSDGHDEVTRA